MGQKYGTNKQRKRGTVRMIRAAVGAALKRLLGRRKKGRGV